MDQNYGNENPVYENYGFINSPQSPQLNRQQQPGIGEAIGTLLVIGGTFLLARDLLGWLFDKPEPGRHNHRGYNRDSLEHWKREYVYERDCGHCTYCGVKVTRRTRHVDHSISRKNGGTNHLNNLRLACRACNLSKGRLNANEFRRRLRVI